MLTLWAEMHGEPVFDIAWCCQHHRMGHGQHLNLKWIWNDGCAKSCLPQHSAEFEPRVSGTESPADWIPADKLTETLRAIGPMAMPLHIYGPRRFHKTWDQSSSCGITASAGIWVPHRNSSKGLMGRWPCRCTSMGQSIGLTTTFIFIGKVGGQICKYVADSGAPKRQMWNIYFSSECHPISLLYWVLTLNILKKKMLQKNCPVSYLWVIYDRYCCFCFHYHYYCSACDMCK